MGGIIIEHKIPQNILYVHFYIKITKNVFQNIVRIF